MAAKPPATPRPEVVGFWRFEHDVKPEPRCPAVGPANRVDGAEFFFSDEVPGPFIYDPLQKLSYPNSASLSFQSGAKRTTMRWPSRSTQRKPGWPARA